MAEPRKIVLILGNGFDIDLGLKTSYKDFWVSGFCPKDYPAPLIHHLNQHLGDTEDTVLWYDLENELYRYASLEKKTDIIDAKERYFIRNTPEYQLSIKSIYTGTGEIFTSLEQKGIIVPVNSYGGVTIPYRDDLLNDASWRDKKAFKLIKKGLCNYLRNIYDNTINDGSIALSVLCALNDAFEAGDFLDVYSFNYTPLPVYYSDKFRAIVHYVHGNSTQGNIIVGTRDDDTIEKDYDFIQKSFDPYYDPPTVVSALRDADDIVIFGHSIGENDRQYFKAFFKQQSDYQIATGKRITIFTNDEISATEINRSLQKMTDSNLSALRTINRVQIIKKTAIKNNPELLSSFLEYYIKRPSLVRALMSKLS